MVGACYAGEGGALGYVVGADEDADAADTDYYAEDLRGVVADAEEEEGDCYYYYYCPEVYELGAEDCSLSL